MRRRGPTVTVQRKGPGLVGTMARTAVVAGTATATVGATKAVMGGGKKQEAQAQAAQQAAYEAGMQDAAAQQAAADQAAAQAAAAQPAAPAGSDLDQQLVEIQKLSTLKDQGLLTEEEFAAKKAQILGI